MNGRRLPRVRLFVSGMGVIRRRKTPAGRLFRGFSQGFPAKIPVLRQLFQKFQFLGKLLSFEIFIYFT
jgi:hypothetical protein